MVARPSGRAAGMLGARSCPIAWRATSLRTSSMNIRMPTDAIVSYLRWPYGWFSSAGRCAAETPTSATTFEEASASEWKPSERIETAPEKYPRAIFANATMRLRARTRRRTLTTERWRSVNYRRALENMRGRDRPPTELHFADDVLLRHEAPVAAVGAVVPVIAHHEVVALGHDGGTEVVVAPELGRDEPIVHRHVVHVHTPVDDAHGVAFLGDDALDERLVRVERVVEHHDVAAARRAHPVHELVDDQPVLVFERRRHAQALDACHLEAEGDDQRRVDGGGEQRLEPRDQLIAPDVDLLHHPRAAVVELEPHVGLDSRFDALLRASRCVERGYPGHRVDRRRDVQAVRRRELGYSFRYSRSRLVWDRLTGI